MLKGQHMVLLLCLYLTSHQQLRSYGDGGHGLKSHPTDWLSRESNLRPLVYEASGLSTTPQRLHQAHGIGVLIRLNTKTSRPQDNIVLVKIKLFFLTYVLTCE